VSDKPVALVTGGSMGLGEAVANHLAQTHVVITCARHAQHDDDVTYGCDVSSAPLVQRMVDWVVRILGRLDVLINNAAIYGPVGQLDAVGWQEWVEAIEINLFGPMLTSRAVLPIMRAQGHGKIINVSGAGVRPHPECTAYNASKAGLVRFTEALAADLTGTDIDVNAVAPGTLDTRMRLRSALPDDPAASMQQAVSLIAWLASSASDGISGRLFSAVWDDWEHLGELGKDDYRMRRVVPA
jgi:NAD(P)-dependent dehydrogenase (short-subunit alcohol dehydrogenase family)